MQGQFISSFFLIPKSDGTKRFILNLKSLNKFVGKVQFKVENLDLVFYLLDKGDFMCKVDLKEAYLTIPINITNRKILNFN